MPRLRAVGAAVCPAAAALPNGEAALARMTAPIQRRRP
jgi:hypothetical protein